MFGFGVVDEAGLPWQRGVHARVGRVPDGLRPDAPDRPEPVTTRRFFMAG